MTLTPIDKLTTIWTSDLINKTGILPSCSLVSTTVRLHHFNETPKEKARWELQKDVAYCFD